MAGNGEIRSYRDLLIWQKGMALAKQIYAMTRAFPGDERFGLTAQMRRAVVSVPSNIAEGQARHGRREFVQFLSHAEGSLAELDTQLALAVELGYCRPSDADGSVATVAELQKMMASLRRKLTARLATNH
ncbi:MAG TPA: four helix bundle protein [Terriglobia bacterium]|jgi:four helix bundle protein|nr:four helix bundle protein [Terriglobia bacterium]